LKAKITEKLQEKHYAQNEMIPKSVLLHLEMLFFSGSWAKENRLIHSQRKLFYGLRHPNALSQLSHFILFIMMNLKQTNLL